MSVREEDRQKNCPSRGLGIAAAAIGVGVGAALYYFFNKRSENAEGEGSSSSWSGEQPHALCDDFEDEDSYTTISEHSTTDTSIHTSADNTADFNASVMSDSSSRSDSGSTDYSNSEYEPDSDSEMNMEYQTSLLRENFLRSIDQANEGWINARDLNGYGVERSLLPNWVTDSTVQSDSEPDWDVTVSSLDVPSEEVSRSRSPLRMLIGSLSQLRSPRRTRIPTEDEQMAILREQAFRERAWTLEECSICFESMLRTHEVMALPCAHRFHQQCILPWLQERHTCPNCRKSADCK